MKQRGRKSADALMTTPVPDISRPKSPEALTGASADLWDRIVRRYPGNHFNDADLQLLREFCHTTATMLPRVNRMLENDADLAMLRARASLVKEAGALAVKLRLCVSSRKRGDLASTRNAGIVIDPPWEQK